MYHCLCTIHISKLKTKKNVQIIRPLNKKKLSEQNRTKKQKNINQKKRRVEKLWKFLKDINRDSKIDV